MFTETTEGNKHQEQKQVTETRKEELNKWISGQKSHSLIKPTSPMIKVWKKLGRVGTFLNIMKSLYDKPLANIILMGKNSKHFQENEEQDTRIYFLCSY